jgi:hypothetical protein
MLVPVDCSDFPPPLPCPKQVKKKKQPTNKHNATKLTILIFLIESTIC